MANLVLLTPKNVVVGDVVHYTNLGDKDGKYPPQVIAAIVTRVEEDHVSLKTLYPTGIFDLEKVQFTDAAAGSDSARGRWTFARRGTPPRAPVEQLSFPQS